MAGRHRVDAGASRGTVRRRHLADGPCCAPIVGTAKRLARVRSRKARPWPRTVSTTGERAARKAGWRRESGTPCRTRAGWGPPERSRPADVPRHPLLVTTGPSACTSEGDLDIPQSLLAEVRSGRAVLFLGAGASRGARGPAGATPPTAPDLASGMARRFLGEEYVAYPLDMVADLALAQSDLATVQGFVAEQLADFQPAPFHRLIPTFRWHGIATTNFDLVIERAYQPPSIPAQTLRVLRTSTDRIETGAPVANPVCLLKLHGCITHLNDPDAPLILTTAQYARYRHARERLFNILHEWGYEHSIVFAGYSFADADLRLFLEQLDNIGNFRPRYYLVTPSTSPVEAAYWERHRIHTLQGTFEDFLRCIDAALPAPLRTLTIPAPSDHPIISRLVIPPTSLSEEVLTYLGRDVDYVHTSLPTATLPPRAFYRGLDRDWSAIQQALDVRRPLIDTVLELLAAPDEVDRPSAVQFIAIRAEAGAGKTVLLKRLAWECATEWGLPCLYLRPNGHLSFDLIAQISRAINERIFLFVDSAADRVAQLDGLLEAATASAMPISVVTVERFNEWNMACEALGRFVTDELQIPYLTRADISLLLALLERHNSLGFLQALPHEERISALEGRAGRQLLVALHEATEGRRFEDILEDEFRALPDERTRQLYLSVCVLNRLGLPVRAGLIARAHDIPFAEFRERLFRPLEFVVEAEENPEIKDMVYRARHPQVAAMVFDRLLPTPQDRCDACFALVSKLNPSYSSDRDAYRRLLRGRDLVELFPKHPKHVADLFLAAKHVGADEGYILHQRGIYEMRRSGGDLDAAHQFLMESRELSQRDPTILHSLAELELERARRGTNPVEIEYHRQRAKALATQVKERATGGSYGYHTVLKVLLDELADILGSGPFDEAECQRLVTDIEDELYRANQRFPHDAYLLAAEAQFASLVKDEERALRSMESAAIAKNARPAMIARFAQTLRAQGNVGRALEVLQTALDQHPTSLHLQFTYGLMLLEEGRVDPSLVAYHMRQAFRPGDRNWLARFWYATCEYLTGDLDAMGRAKEQFEALRSVQLAHEERVKVRAVARAADGSPAHYTGVVVRLSGTHGFVRRDQAGDQLFMHQSEVAGIPWQGVKPGMRVAFQLGFTAQGPVACGVSLESRGMVAVQEVRPQMQQG